MDLCGGVFDHSEELKERLHSCAPAEEFTGAATSPVPAGKWTVRRMKESFALLSAYSLAGISLFVRAAGIQLRHGRPQYFRPDPASQPKEATLLRAWQQVGQHRGRLVALFVDELSYTRWPEPSLDWGAQAPEPPPLADRKQSR